MEAAAVRQTASVAEEEPQGYPVPDTLYAINIQDGTRYEKKHFLISENYKVRMEKMMKLGLHRLCSNP